MRYLFGFLCVCALGVMGCGETAGAGPAMIQVLVTNDDGIAAPGIDALVEALRAEPMVELTVVAPDGNRSGSGDTTTEGPVNGVAATTESGFAGYCGGRLPGRRSHLRTR